MIGPINDLDFLGVVFPQTETEQEKPLAMAFVQNQTTLDVMDLEQGFSTGTIFKGLDKPFKPWGNAR